MAKHPTHTRTGVIGTLRWWSCPDCALMKKDAACPMDTLDLWLEDNFIVCNLFVEKNPEGAASAKK